MERGVRVVHVAEAFGGGLYEVVRLLANGAAERGVQVTVIHGRRPETPEWPAEQFDRRVELHEMAWGERQPAEQLRAARDLRALVARQGADVIHLHSSFAGIVGGLALRGAAPIVYTPHSFASCLPTLTARHRRPIIAAERLAISRADWVGAVSQTEADCARRRGARLVSVIRNGIRELDAPPEPSVDRELQALAGTRPRIIAGGRLVDQRRPEACARILSAVASDADVAWVGGGGSAGRDLMAAALTSAGVEVTGWVPRERWLDELGAAAAYLHWTAWDGQPLCLLEALARDVIAIASDTPPNREVLPPAQLARTEDEAAALLRRIATDRRFADRLREGQRERAAAFGAERMVEEWLELYGMLAGRRVRPLPVVPQKAVAAPAVAAEALAADA